MQAAARASSPVASASRVARKTVRRLPLYILLIPMALVTLMPVIYMFSVSFTPEADTLRWPIYVIPQHPTLDNFQRLLNDPTLPILRWMFNSLFISTSITLLVLVVNSLAAYGFARLEFPGRDALFIGLLTTLMIPGQVTLIPTFLIMHNLGWLNTYNAMIWPAGANVLGIFLLRQFFQSIPRELEEAAIIDGSSKLRTYWSIILPLGRSAMVALAIFTFLSAWNDLFWPLIVLNSTQMETLPVGLTILTNSNLYTRQGETMAAAALTSVPVLILYAIFQRRI